MKRIVTALILIPTVSYAVLGEWEWLFLLILTAVAVLCFYEYEGIVAAHGVERPGPMGYVLGLAVLLTSGSQFTPALIALTALVLALRAANLRNALSQASAMTLGVIYIFGAWRCAIDLRAVSKWWLLFALALNWAGDIAAMYTGRAIGKHKLAPRISPGKSWEGAVASTVASMAFGAVYAYYLLPAVPIYWVLLLAGLGNIAGQLGDLCESALKRGAGLKDSGTLLPGHGGWLDRVDSSLFALPVVWFLLQSLERWAK
ncbi:MAG: phosphatidate cytidylyltransferase [Bryobacteraceae bacterium]